MSGDHDDVDRLTALIPLLAQQGYDVGSLFYPSVRELAQSGAIPAHQGANYIWQFRRRDTSAIAAALRIKKRVTPPAITEAA
jgi:hypothetical protein